MFIRHHLSLVVTALLCACTHVAPRYGISAGNVDNMKSAAPSPARQLSVAPFTTFEAGLKSISCRAAGPVEPPDGLTFEKYIENAFVSELKLAGLFAADAPTKLRGRLDYINFNSNIGFGKWQIDMTVSADAAQPFAVKTVSSFSTNFVADVACNQVATALPVAVQELIAQIVADPGFRPMLATPVASK